MHRLNLHIGTHKTGTTSVQRFLAVNRDVLRRQGILYPENSIGGFKNHYAHHRIAHAIAERPDAGTPKDARRFFDELRRTLAEGEAAVISAEAMYRHVLPAVGDGEDPAFNAGGGIAGDPLTYIRRVRECIGEFDVTVMVMLRRQDLFIESLYAEQILTSSYSAGIDHFVSERWWLADFEQRLGMWADVFGPESLSVRVFEPKAFGMSIEQYFVEWMGGTWDDEFVLGSRYNVTVPRSLVEYRRAINNKQPRPVSNQYRRWLETLADDEQQGDLPDLGRHYLTQAARREFIERFEHDNRLIAERHFHRSELFPDTPDVAAYADPPKLSSRQFRMTTQMLLRSMAERKLEQNRKDPTVI